MNSHDFVKQKIKNDEILKSIKNVLSNQKAWLVGGFVRDLFLGIQNFDRDIVVEANAKKIAQDVSNYLNATYIELDAENEIYRVVLQDKKNYFDISCALDSDILKDAKRRDFTLNSIMFDINKNSLFDPCGGILALEQKKLICADLNNLSDDPLRMLRVFRFVALYNFYVEEDVLIFIKNNAELIKKCAQERINQELLKLFSGNHCADALLLADKYNFLNKIFPFVDEIKKIPPNSHHHLNLFHHCIETMRTVRTNNPLLKLAAFCHDIGKPKTHTIEPDGRHRFIGHDKVGGELIRPILSNLKFSKKQIDYISAMIENHIYPSSLMSSKEVQDKAKIRFIKKLDPYVEDIIELARADRLCARGPMVSKEMVEENLKNLCELLNFYKKIKPKLEKLPKLLDGKEIMQILNIKPSPILGKAIEALKIAQIEGEVYDSEQARIFVKRWFIETVKKCNKID